jgi:hypothetical protein
MNREGINREDEKVIDVHKYSSFRFRSSVGSTRRKPMGYMETSP